MGKVAPPPAPPRATTLRYQQENSGWAPRSDDTPAQPAGGSSQRRRCTPCGAPGMTAWMRAAQRPAAAGLGNGATHAAGVRGVGATGDWMRTDTITAWPTTKQWPVANTAVDSFKWPGPANRAANGARLATAGLPIQTQAAYNSFYGVRWAPLTSSLLAVGRLGPAPAPPPRVPIQTCSDWPWPPSPWTRLVR